MLHGFKPQKWNYAPSCNSALAGSATKMPMLKSVIHKCTLSQQLLGFFGTKKATFDKGRHILSSQNFPIIPALFKNSILLPKLFLPTLRKNCSSDWEKLLKSEAAGREFAKKISVWENQNQC